MLAPYRVAAESAIDVATKLAAVPRTGKRGKEGVKNAINRVFSRCEDAGIIPRLPAIDESYADYPELRELERNYAMIREECLRVLDVRERVPDISSLAGGYTAGGIHTARWKALMLKAGRLVPENAALCPRTSELVGGLRRVHTAFFSILEPHQYITPHWGYFKGFVRYHLAVVIPDDNAERKCWLRINADPEANRKHDKSMIEQGTKYYWHEGRGVVFDDTNLHDAANESDQVRVVLWLDVLRDLPAPLALYAQACISAISLEPSIRKVRQNAVVRGLGAARVAVR